MSSSNRPGPPGVFANVKRILAALALVSLGLVACQQPADVPGGVVTGTAVSGPSCPVVTEPPDPACEDRPLAGAEILILNRADEVVASTRTAGDGSFSVEVPAGEYRLVPQPVEGLMGTAQPIEIVVAAGLEVGPLELSYDTGIR